jgi:pyruvate kinase
MPDAKIVCTLGPATSSLGQIRKMIDAGMDVVRINRSHGTHKEHETAYANVRQAAEEAGANVAVLVDLQGPKIRLGRFADGPHELEEGDPFTITTRDVEGTKDICGTTYPGLAGDARVGDPLLVDDGKITLRITEVTDTDVVTTVEVGGSVSDHKGINLPGVAVSVPALSEKDATDLRWALKLGADFIALSFVRSAKDYKEVKKVMKEVGRKVPVIAKIEKPQAVENLAKIIKAFDGIMIARGDLGVEMPLEEVPLLQKHAIDLCRSQSKPVIVATQVLESMTHSPRPTRAETSDCANAVLDGADAVMLSGETAIGEFPIITVKTMARIIETTEDKGHGRIAPYTWLPKTKGGAITASVVKIAESLEVKAIAIFTQSGDSAQRMSRLRSEIPIYAFTPVPSTRARLALSWGIQAELIDKVPDVKSMIELVDERFLSLGAAKEGDMIIVVSGTPIGTPGTTNSIVVRQVGQPVG